ncbi:MAG TPA: ferredoxin [Marmoricola sp.]|nr:ferredoxin [Nocardioidaceae bacterium]MCB8992943.1 ferredoxin [Nocardioidaceae bacterium]MCO5324959.1 ferredoxin [Nocardioidaceae bacterium]HMU35235.1 ferredoxin [Marmoricola sp.]HRV69178.1 ferredoxin [Marmoricola sp.]
MKIRVDMNECESNALCVAISPDNFYLNDDDYLEVIDDQVTDENRERIQRAVNACPKSAISIVED